MAIGKDKSAIPITANIPEPVVVKFEVAMAQRRMKKQEALAEAMQQWAASETPRISAKEIQTPGQFGVTLSFADMSAAERTWMERLMKMGADLLKSLPGRSNEHSAIRTSNADIDRRLAEAGKKASETLKAARKLHRDIQNPPANPGTAGHGDGGSAPKTGGGGGNPKVDPPKPRGEKAG